MTENRELVTPGPLRLIACPHPLSITKDRIDRHVPEGATIAEHIRALGWRPETLAAVVYLNDVLVPQAEWEYAVPAAGQMLCVRAIPMDSGGNAGKSALRIVAMLAVVVAGVFTAGSTWGALAIGQPLVNAFGFGVASQWAGAAGAMITMAGSGLIPPSVPLRRGVA